jgi:hypothetical protein
MSCATSPGAPQSYLPSSTTTNTKETKVKTKVKTKVTIANDCQQHPSRYPDLQRNLAY